MDISYYNADKDRYKNKEYRKIGKSGLKLPPISLGLWHNFGFVDRFENSRAILRSAFDNGVTHFDLANNYGPPYGSAEENFGKAMQLDFAPYRDEMIISSKAGYDMWEGPYGNGGSRKYLISSCDQSLKRMNLEYVDIFYSHRYDPETPIEETMMALDQIVKSGKALYAGISNYPPEQTQEAIDILKSLGTPLLIHQNKHSMFMRESENGLLDLLEREGVGSIAFSPLAQGLLTNRYLKGIPQDSRMARDNVFLTEKNLSDEVLKKIKSLNDIAESRDQSLAQMALSWLLKDNRISSVLVGASSVEQLKDNLKSAENINFSKEELNKIESILS